MNTIKVENNNIISNDFKIINNIISIDKDVNITYLDSDVNLVFNIKKSSKVFENIINSRVNNTYNILKNVTFSLNRYSDNSSIITDLNLNEDNANVLYNYALINKSDLNYILNIYHNNSNTSSIVNNRGINFDKKSLKFNINAYIQKKSFNTICHQDNRIITKNNSESKINPNLIIDNNDTKASHAAYIGSFDLDEKFYLKSRGLNDKKIDSILTKAFLLGKLSIDNKNKEELIQKIDNYWR